MTPQSLSLYELNCRIKETLHHGFPAPLWVRAEIGEMKVNQSGHCYLEFVEKDGRQTTVVARCRAMIWASTFRVLKYRFEQETGQSLAAGLRVMVQAEVEFHEQYGLSLKVKEIDSSFTLGEMALQRKEILRRLEEDGVLTLNKELPLSTVPQRIAVISSPTAAGYEDFINQLHHNPMRLVFYPCLFGAVMQGAQTELSVIAALNRIYLHRNQFDVVVIIRGGGAVTDLASFDSYQLAFNCAQFPLPIVSGIGHERDETVVDAVAHTRVKTPTAAAEFLIERCEEALINLEQYALVLKQRVTETIQFHHRRLDTIVTDTQNAVDVLLLGQRNELSNRATQIRTLATHRVQMERQTLEHKETMIEAVSPLNVLARGFSLSYKNGNPVSSTSQLSPGDKLDTLFADGVAESVVTSCRK